MTSSPPKTPIVEQRLSNYQAVKQFTEESTGIKTPAKPVPMNRDSVFFLIKMVMSELDEVAATVCTDEHDKADFMLRALDQRDLCANVGKGKYPTDVDTIAAQADGIVDSWYYMLNVAAKHSIDVSSVFDIVHAANMAKRDPATGKFLRRDDGKIIKPAGWQPPDVESEILRQME